MNSFSEDLLAIIIAKLPIKIFTTCKLVCKQWKSIVESPYFRDLFLSLHQNLNSSSWSLMYRDLEGEVMALYGCDTWGLERSLGSHISSFLTNKFGTHRDVYIVWDYTDVGLILVSEDSISTKNRSLYVANPVTQECVEIPSHAHIKEYVQPLGIATRTENGLLLDYKVVLTDGVRKNMSFSMLIYSSETGLWSLNTVHLPFSLCCQVFSDSISLNGNIYWLGCNINDHEHEDVVLSMDFYATGIGSDQCRVMTFPDLGKDFRLMGFCRISQGFIMYMTIVSSIAEDDGSLEDKLYVWRLKNWEWQLISEISMPFLNPDCDYSLLTINPFDANTVYFWSFPKNNKQQNLLSINLRNGKFVIHGELERSSNGGILISPGCPIVGGYKNEKFVQTFVLPQWLHRIPKTMSIV